MKTISGLLILIVAVSVGYFAEPFFFPDINDGVANADGQDAGAVENLSVSSKFEDQGGADLSAIDKSKHDFSTLSKHELEPFLKKYCVECHGPKKQKAQVRFDTVEWDIASNDSAQRWQDVLDQLNGGEMPPEEEEQPTSKEMADALYTLTGMVTRARRRLADHGGEIKMRRLNRREYTNTINHLFGFDVPLDTLPEDGEFKSFDTVGDEQFFTSLHFEKYFEHGQKIMREAFRWSFSPRQPRKKHRVHPETLANGRLKAHLEEFESRLRQRNAGKNWQEMGMKDEGEFKTYFGNMSHVLPKMKKYLANPYAGEGVYLTDLTGTTTGVSINRHVDIRGEYKLRIHGGVVGDTLPMRHVARIYDSSGTRSTVGLLGTPKNPETVEVNLRQSVGRFGLMLSVSENVPQTTFGNSTWLHAHLERLQGSAAPLQSLWIDWLEVEGPYYAEEKSFFERVMTEQGHPRYSRYKGDEHADELIEKFAYEAFRRREPDADYLKGLQARYHELRAGGISHQDAVGEVFALVLSSPSFLYLQEAETEVREVKMLDNRELAVRLSYYLWSSPPDDELYAANLSDPLVRSAQVDRLLASPKAEAFRDGFISQWAEFDRFRAITIDEKEQPHFNDGVRQSAEREVREFFGVLIDENLPARNLIDSDFVTVNATMAAHYGIKDLDVKSDKFVKVNLPSESPYGGFMTQAAFLIAGSNGERSSPVIRGALLMEKLLNDKPAPPPPNVPELSAASLQPKTNREMVLLHQKQLVCASCHKKMDVIGFGLENFDTIGKFRVSELVGDEQVTIDPSGALPGGGSFSNVQELKKMLLGYEKDMARGLTEHILAYGLGRTVEFSDADDVDAIIAKIAANGYRIRDMIKEIAMSELFGRK